MPLNVFLGEAQQIERVMEAFAGEYYQQQPFVTTPQLSKQLEEVRAQQQRRQRERSVALPPSPESSTVPSAPKSSKKQGGGKSKEEEDLRFSIPRWVISEGAYWRQKEEEAREEARGGAGSSVGGRERRARHQRCQVLEDSSRSTRRGAEEEGERGSGGGSLMEFLQEQIRKARGGGKKRRTEGVEEDGKQEKKSHLEKSGKDWWSEGRPLDVEEAVECIMRKEEAGSEEDEEQTDLRDALTKQLSSFSTDQVGGEGSSAVLFLRLFSRNEPTGSGLCFPFFPWSPSTAVFSFSFPLLAASLYTSSPDFLVGCDVSEP